MDDTSFNLNGYIGTTMKPLGTQILISHKGEPVLALWQCGLGKTVAWTSDVNGEWSGPLFESNKGTQLFKNLLSWSMTTYEGKGNVKITDEGKGAKITFTTNEINANKKVKVSYQNIEGHMNEADLSEVSPGIYESNLPLDKNGFYAFNVTEETDGTNTGNYVTAFAKQYSKEYKFIEDQGALDQLIEAVNGKLVTLPNEAFKMKNKLSYRTVELTNTLLLLVAIWFWIDVIVRRFKLSFSMIGSLITKFTGRESLSLKSEKAKAFKSSVEDKNEKVPTRKATHIEESLATDKEISFKRTEVQKEKRFKTKSEKKQKQKKAESTVLDTASLLKHKKDREF